LSGLPYRTAIFIKKLKAIQFSPQLSPHSVPTACPRSSNSNPVSTLFAAVAVVQPIAATIDIALYLHNSTSRHEQ
jgi:hypothetical protein